MHVFSIINDLCGETANGSRAPLVQLVSSKPSDVLGREFESRRSHTNRDISSHHAQRVENDYFVGTQNSANPIRGQLHRDCSEVSPVPLAPENFISRDGFGRPVAEK